MSLPASCSLPVDLGGHRIFITGGTGFVGRSLLDYLAESAQEHRTSFEAVVLSRDPAGFLRRHPSYAGHAWLTFRAGDVEQLDPAAAVSAGRFTDVIHAAADARSSTDGLRWMQQIVQGTRRSLEFAVATGARRYLLASSGAVYGPQPHDMISLAEEYPGAPRPEEPSSAYGQAKRFAEQLCTSFRHDNGLETISARLFALVSPHVPLDGGYAIGNFIRDALQGRAIRVAGDGTAVRSYLYGRDCAHWTFSLLLNGASGHSYNVGSDHAISIAELAHRVAACLSPASPVRIERSLSEAQHRSRYVPAVDKALALGLRVETPLDLAIQLSAAAQGMIR